MIFFLTGVDSVVEDSSKRKETEVVGRSSAANEAEPSLEEKTIPSSTLRSSPSTS